MLRRNGTTMVELLLVLGILMVIAGLLWLSRGTTVETRELRGDGAALLGLLRQARTTAIGRSTRTRVLFDPALNRAILELVEDPLESLDMFAPPAGDWAAPVELTAEILVEGVDRDTGLTADTVVFHSDGTADPLDWTLSHPKLPDRIRVSVDSLTGIASMRELAVGEE